MRKLIYFRGNVSKGIFCPVIVKLFITEFCQIFWDERDIVVTIFKTCAFGIIIVNYC